MAQKMKDSGIPWIGEMPEGWEVKRGKELFVQSRTKGNQRLVLQSATQDKGVVDKDTLEGVVQVATDADLSQFKTVHVDDFVISLRSFQGGFEIAHNEGVISPAYTVFRFREKSYTGYFRHLFKSFGFIDKINSLTVGIREGKNIQYEDFANMDLPFPPLWEQERIAGYLDRRCGEMDALVGVEERLVEQLKAYKQALITEAVTHGLNPNSPSKPSSIPWLPSIPKHWQMGRLKNVGFLYGGLTGKSGDDFNVEEEENNYMLYIPYTNIFNHDTIDPNQLYKVKVVNGEKQNYVMKDDLLFLMSSEDYDGVGKPAIMESQVERLGLNSFCKGFHVSDRRTYPKFLFYLLSAHLHRELIRQEAKGFIRINLRQDKLSACPIFLPPINEQREIADYLDDRCEEVDRLVELKRRKVEALKEAKRSLIYECVTGKRPPVD